MYEIVMPEIIKKDRIVANRLRRKQKSLQIICDDFII